MTPDELERVVRDYVIEGSGLGRRRVIPGNARGSRPTVTYATVLFVGETALSHPKRRVQASAAGTITIEAHHLLAEFNIQFYRDGYLDAATRFADWAETELGLRSAIVKCFRMRLPQRVDRLDLPVADRWERRATLRVMIEYERETVAETGAIEHADVHLSAEVRISAEG